MKKIRFRDVVETKQIEYEDGEYDFEDYGGLEAEEEEIVPTETEEQKWEKANRWSNLFLYVFYLSAFGTSTAVFPKALFLALSFSTGYIFDGFFNVTPFTIFLRYLFLAVRSRLGGCNHPDDVLGSFPGILLEETQQRNVQKCSNLLR